jgi:putative membrane protein
MILASLQGLPAFLLYFFVGVVLLAAYTAVYTRLTTHDEFGLIEQGNAPAAVAFGMSMLGFAIPLGSAAAHSVSIVDLIVWGLVALAVQSGAYLLARWRLSDLSGRIARGDWAAALSLGFLSLTCGILNAVSMST